MNLIKEHWTMVDYQNFLDYLKENSDDVYHKFTANLIPGIKIFYGCRSPFLKKTAKMIRKGNYQEFLDLNPKTSHEEKLIYGNLISIIPVDFQTRLDYIRGFLPYIDNWAVCDALCTNLKDFKKYQEEGFLFIEELLQQKETYTIRLAIVLLLAHFINEDYLDKIYNITDSIQSEEYYVNMAIAWLISICYIKYPERTMPYLLQNKLSDWVHNKAIQKICESQRLSKEEKHTLRQYKR